MRRALVRCAVLTLAVGCSAPSAPVLDPALFRDPPADLGPHVRWWWPGGAVDDATIEVEVGRLADLGFAGIELQPMAMGLGPDDLTADPRVRTVRETEQLARVRAFLAAAEARGLRTSLTLGSGWPSGGRFSVDVRPQELLLASVDVVGPATVHLPVPAPTPPGWVAPVFGLFPVFGTFPPTATLVAVLLAPLVDADAAPPVLGPPPDVTAAMSAGTVDLTVPEGPHVVIFVQQHTVDHLVGGGAFPGLASDAKVVDHLDPRGAATLLAEQAGPWLDALAPQVPDEVFVDSFELVGELPWATDIADAFEATWGYPITPDLPFVLREGGESKYADILRPPAGPAYAADDAHGERVREDYEDLRGDRFRAAFIAPVAAFAADRHTALRLQAHGGYAPVLDAYTLADVPESEGLYAQGSMDFLELAASAAHVAGRSTVSSESFVAVSPLGTPMTEDERWMLAGRAYVAGINRLMFHGAAYPYVRANGATRGPFVPDPDAGVVWSGPFLITSRFEPDSAEASTLPEFTLALTRLSYAMTRGTDVAEVAWLRAEPAVQDVCFLRI